MGKILSLIPGFRSRTPWVMIVAGIYYILSLSMMLISVWLGIFLLSGPFLLFRIDAVSEYHRTRNARSLIALMICAAVCGGSLIGFAYDISDSGPIQMTAAYKTSATAPTPLSDTLAQAIVLQHSAGGMTVQFADESNGEIRYAGITIPEEKEMETSGFLTGTVPPGSLIYLERDPSADSADYYVWLARPLTDSSDEVREKVLNAILIDKGYALTSDTYCGRYADLFMQYQTGAGTLWLNAESIAPSVSPTLPFPPSFSPTEAPTPPPTLVPTPPSAPETTLAPTLLPEPTPAPEPAESMDTPLPEPDQEEPVPPPSGVYYCGSKNSDVFHLSTCASVSRISPENLVIYTSREDAIRQGKRPCKKCNP